MRRGWPGLIAFLLLAATPAPTQAQPESVAVETAAIVHAAGIGLPDRLCGLTRREFGRHPQTDGVMATYAGTDAWIDVFIVRVGRPLGEDFVSSAQATQGLTPGLVEIGDFAAPPGITGARGRIWRGQRGDEPLLTGVLLWHRDGWRTKVLASAFPGRGGPGWAVIECAIRAMGGAPATT